VNKIQSDVKCPVLSQLIRDRNCVLSSSLVMLCKSKYFQQCNTFKCNTFKCNTFKCNTFK